MKQLLKGGVRILYDYVITLTIFLIFLYPFMGLTKESFNDWLPLYSLLLFLFLFFLVYVDMKDTAKKEKKPQYQLNPYPIKGLVYGLISVVPFALAVAVAFFLQLGYEASGVLPQLVHIAVNALLGPLYFVIRLMNESVLGYAAAISTIPAIATLGYLAGYFNINVMKVILRKKEVISQKEFTKSPWNPSITEKKGSGGKKGKKKNVL